MTKQLLIVGALAILHASPAVANEGETGKVCYQNLCLLDPIQKLNLPVAKIEFKAKPGPQDAETLSLGRKIFKADAAVADLLVREGFIYGEPNSITQTTLAALRKVRAVCGRTASAFQVHVRADGGRNVILGYKPVTAESAAPGYRLTSLSIAYPEVQSAGDKRELFARASEALKLRLPCYEATNFECRVDGAASPSAAEFYAGRFILRAENPAFNLDAATQHPECKSSIKF